MKEIPLTRGKVAIVDDADYEWLNQWKWHCDKDGYAVRWIQKHNIKKRILMHRLIMGDPKGLEVDHVNRKKHDNRRSNLRSATCSQNHWNKGIGKQTSSGYLGVRMVNKNNRKCWGVQIKANGNVIHIGVFADKTEAAIAYNQAIGKYHGEFAVFNDIPGWENLPPIENKYYLRLTNTSGYHGVNWEKRDSKWRARITINGKRIYLGYFTFKIDAAIAYNNAAIKYLGKSALLNKIPKKEKVTT